VAQFVETLYYKMEGRGFDFQWCHWNFSVTKFFWPHHDHGFDSASKEISKIEWSLNRPGFTQRMGRVTALLFHDRGTRRGWVVSSTPRPQFTPGKERVPIWHEAGWAPGPVWTDGKSRLHRNSIPDRPAHSQSLYRLSYPTHNRNDDQGYFLGGKCGRCLGLTTFPPSCADCLEICDPQPPGTLRVSPGLYRVWFTFTCIISNTYIPRYKPPPPPPNKN